MTLLHPVRLRDVSRLMTRAFMGGVKATTWTDLEILAVVLGQAETMGLDVADDELNNRLRVQIDAGRRYAAMDRPDRARVLEIAGDAIPGGVP